MRTSGFLVYLWVACFASAADLRVPGATAYLDPTGGGARVSSRSGVTNWSDAGTDVLWYGKFSTAGQLSVTVIVGAISSSPVNLTMCVGEQTREATLEANPDDGKDSDFGKEVVLQFGKFAIEKPGYYTFRLKRDDASNEPLRIRELILTGDATANAHFNLKSRRNAASVHLRYPVARGSDVSVFYCEMTALEDPLWSYYMACGWHRGYFGMQVNSETERRIIFSVWDSGNEEVDRAKVAPENRVSLVEKGDGVYSGDFGNEGTGGHSHLKFQWKTGERQRFLVTAEPVGESHTIFAGYYFRPDQEKWMLISSWKTPKEGGYMRALYSFSENFVGRNGNLVRKALYGNQWIRTADGRWHELTKSIFSHDVTGRSDRLDRFMGLEDGQFFLSHGGFVDGFTKSGEPFSRPATKRSPSDSSLPNLPATKLPSQ